MAIRQRGSTLDWLGPNSHDAPHRATLRSLYHYNLNLSGSRADSRYDFLLPLPNLLADLAADAGYNRREPFTAPGEKIDLEEVCALYGFQDVGPVRVWLESGFGTSYRKYYGCIGDDGRWEARCPNMLVYHHRCMCPVFHPLDEESLGLSLATDDIKPRLTLASTLGDCGLSERKIVCNSDLKAVGSIVRTSPGKNTQIAPRLTR